MMPLGAASLVSFQDSAVAVTNAFSDAFLTASLFTCPYNCVRLP
jgi:hypothetical protein